MALGYQVKLRFMIDQKDSLDTMLFIKGQLNLFLTHRKLQKGFLGVKNKYHLTKEGLSEIRILSKQINLITSVTNKTGDKLNAKMKI